MLNVKVYKCDIFCSLGKKTYENEHYSEKKLWENLMGILVEDVLYISGGRRFSLEFSPFRQLNV